jgi:predicted LPLAT superfamily acyltransferase
MDLAKALETFPVWTGGIDHARVVFADQMELDHAAADPRGALFIVSHLGGLPSSPLTKSADSDSLG